MGPIFLHVDSEDSDQTGRMLGAQVMLSSLGAQVILLVLSCGGSNVHVQGL